MKYRGRTTKLIAGTLLLAAFASVTLAAQGEVAADRRETVAGWVIEDVADHDFGDDPMARVVRMTRTLDNQELSYEVRLSGYGGSGWASTAFSANMGHQNTGCNRGSSAAVETGAPAQRPARLRALLLRELGRLESSCRAPAGTAAPLLEGFEAAFARLSAWHGERFAELEAAREAGYVAGYGMDPDNMMAADMEAGMNDAMMDDMSMDAMVDMNGYDMSMDANYVEMDMGSTDMNATWDENAAEYYAENAVEAAAAAAEAAADAAEAAIEDEPKR